MKLLANELFGKNLQKIRKSRNLTQEQTVAQMCILGSSISRSTYSIIELGRGNIFISDLVCLQKIFDVDYSEFFKDIPSHR